MPSRNIPLWVQGLNLSVLAILCWKAWAAFVDPAAIFGPTQDYARPHVHALWELAGRNLAMIAISLWALLRRSREAFAAVFLMGLVRETADMIFASGLMPGDGGQFQPASVSFLVFLVGYALALWRLRQP